MRPEKQQLIHELLQDAPRGATHLQAGVRALRRRRFWRTARRGMAGLLVVAAAALWLEQAHFHSASRQASVPSTMPSAQPNRQALTDDQLLALFPNTPVALATLSDGTKRLIFPRPEDAKRYLGHL